MPLRRRRWRDRHWRVIEHDSQKEQRESFLAAENAFGLVAALLLSISIGTLFLAPREDKTNDQIDDITIIRYCHVILNVISASCSASSLVLGFFRAVWLAKSPVSLTNDVIVAFVGNSRDDFALLRIISDPFIQLRGAYFTLLFSLPFCVFLLHGRTLSMVTAIIIFVNALAIEIVSRVNVLRAYKIVRNAGNRQT